ncbi:MAG: methionine--tRNA ligase subunit beta, partial [Candidatus Acidiferrales bacterium]
NVAYPEPIVKAFDELADARVGNDALRYYLLGETVFGQDGDFSREALITRYNASLAHGLGNAASRILAMIRQYFDGLVPDLGAADKQGLELQEWAEVTIQRTGKFYEDFVFQLVIAELDTLVGKVDKYLSFSQPWAMAGDAARLHDLECVLYRAAETLRIAVALAYPVIPNATQKIWEQLGQTGSLADVRIDQLKWGGLEPGTKIGKPEAVFPRVDKKETLEKIEMMENEIRNPGAAQPAAATSSVGAAPATAPATATAAIAPPAAPASTTITIDDFAKIDLRVGIVKTAERIPGADKLLKLQVDLGSETRQILSGIAPAYTPEELVGRKVVVVANLASRKMRGLESAGMILAASDGADGKPILCTFDDEIAPGAKVK